MIKLNYTTEILSIKDKLINSGFTIQPGISASEITKIEQYYNIQFPDDYKTLLQSFTIPEFYQWNDFSRKNILKIRRVLRAPIHGILFDVGHNGFWHASWGNKPSDPVKAFILAYNELKPLKNTLIPIFGHRYLRSDLIYTNSPVYSIYQTDMIIYGSNLWAYLEHEFLNSCEPQNIKYDIKDNSFWSDILYFNNCTDNYRL